MTKAIRQKLKLTLRESDKETNEREEHEAISGVSKIATSNNVPSASEAVTALRSLQCAFVDCYIQVFRGGFTVSEAVKDSF